MNSFNSNFSETTSLGNVAFVQASWHREIVDALRDSFLKTYAEIDNREVELFEVPRAFKIPLRAKLLACTGQYAGIVAAGLIVDCGIYRHEVEQIRAAVNQIANAIEHVSHGARSGGFDRMLHFHSLHDRKSCVRLNLLPCLDK